MKKILIVDDSIDIVSSLVDLFEESGYETHKAYTASDALKITKSIMPDLIICDILMPKINGYEFLEEIRRGSITSKIPVLFLSAKASKEEIKKGLESGANGYIVKPYDSLALLSKVNDSLAMGIKE